jgi:hypothetical protein
MTSFVTSADGTRIAFHRLMLALVRVAGSDEACAMKHLIARAPD